MTKMITRVVYIVVGALLLSSIDAFVPAINRNVFPCGRYVSLQSSDVSYAIGTEQRWDGLELFFSEQQPTEQLVSSVPSIPNDVITVDEAESMHGMPWKSSINPKVENDALLYMPFWNWHMSFMKDNLTNLRVMPCSNGKIDFSYNENNEKKARIVNLCLSSSEYRKIRLTYYDAGDNTQVYNAVFYPNPEYNLPILGIDLLSFNRKKFLTIVDFQPLVEDSDLAASFEALLKPIKEKYDSLKGRMSSKFYDETKFFSKEMLFARFEDEDVIKRDLFPAFQSYVKTHLNLIRDTQPQPQQVEYVMERQKAYDTYSAERDPAIGLFATMYGNDWAQDFMHDFLFSMSERKEGDNIIPNIPSMGGPPPSVNKKPEDNQSREEQQPVAFVKKR